MLRGVLSVTATLLIGAACAAGPHLERHHRDAAKSASISAEPAPAPSSSPSPSPSMFAQTDHHGSRHLLHAALGCFTGGAWMEALGSTGEERTIATTHRCRLLSTDGMGAKPEDDVALAAARAIEPKAVDAIVAKISEPELATLFRLFADAAREAADARKLADSIRKDKNAKVDDALGKKDALVKLRALNAPMAKVAAMVLAADHVESSRGLPPRAKILTAAPAFETVFNVARPSGDDWIAYASAAAKAGNHAPSDNSEKAAFAGVVATFADKFEALAKEAKGESREVATGYAKRLREELTTAVKK
jgi:hypothetical protein